MTFTGITTKGENIKIMTNKPDCSRHLKEVAGISDMEKLAEMVGDLHYETLTKFLDCLSLKISKDAILDESHGRKDLAAELYLISGHLFKATANCDQAWRISKPYMSKKLEPTGDKCHTCGINLFTNDMSHCLNGHENPKS